MKNNLKILIIYISFHNKNTEKIAKAIGDELDAKIIPFSMINIKEIQEADLVGFGSGVYFSKFHNLLNKFIEGLPNMNNKKTFIFSTSGIKKNIILNRSHEHFSKLLNGKGFDIVGEFNCLGFDFNGPLKIIGGINKGRPNERDIQKAKIFAKKLKNSINDY
jgi:flavodoxin